jgi:hypothetical protein
LAHVHKTNRQDHRPERGQKRAAKATREGVAERLAEAAVQPRRAGDWALLTAEAQLLGDRDRSSAKAAPHQDATPLYCLPTGPGSGTSLSLVRRDDLHDMARFPRGQACVASGRLVTWANEAAGQRRGPSGKTSGHAPRTWAFPEAAAWFLRHQPEGQRGLARVEHRHAKGQAFTLPAHPLARAVDDLLQRHMALALDTCRQREGSSAGEPAASLAPPRDAPAAIVRSALSDGVVERRGTPRPCRPEPGALSGHPRWLRNRRRPVAQGCVGGPSPEPGAHGRVKTPQPPLGRGRDEGTAVLLGRRGDPQRCSALAMQVARAPQSGCGAATSVGTWARQSRQAPSPCAAGAGTTKAGKSRKIRSQGSCGS